MQRIKMSLVLAVFIVIFGYTFANAGEYAGELCWAMDGPSQDIRLKLGFYHIGGQHYLVSGTEFQQDGTAKSLHGNAEMIGGFVVISYTVVHTGVDAQKGPYVTAKHGEIVLDPNTLNGNLSVIDVDAYPDGDDHIGDFYCSLKNVPCQ